MSHQAKKEKSVDMGSSVLCYMSEATLWSVQLLVQASRLLWLQRLRSAQRQRRQLAAAGGRIV